MHVNNHTLLVVLAENMHWYVNYNTCNERYTKVTMNPQICTFTANKRYDK